MISVIMSAYNASKTITRAIESVLNQTYKYWELVIVDDKSTDNTLDIINKYEDDRIKVITHSENLGAGFARRTGIENMTGEWMTFLDSDDYLKEDCLATLFFASKLIDADIINAGMTIVNQNNDVILEKIPEFNVEVGGAKFSQDKGDTKRFTHGMLFKGSLWNKVQYSSRRYIEDTPTLVQLLYYADKVFNINYSGYYYVQNDLSLTHQASDMKNAIFQALCVKDINNFFASVGHSELLNIEHFNKLYNHIVENINDQDKLLYNFEINELTNYNNSIYETKTSKND